MRGQAKTPARVAHRDRLNTGRYGSLPVCAVCGKQPVSNPGTSCGKCRQAAGINGNKWKPGIHSQIRTARGADIPLVGCSSWWLQGEAFYLRAKLERGRIQAQGQRWTKRAITDTAE